ncbi:hypothetical protein GCM10023147_27770 [Tsukamurella soli]|uniref:Uncharacterized protein n=1 Tax=Tsukamurella soli TaxID=644556 RepID=A0ABP8JRS0_9ACTN
MCRDACVVIASIDGASGAVFGDGAFDHQYAAGGTTDVDNLAFVWSDSDPALKNPLVRDLGIDVVCSTEGWLASTRVPPRD